MILFRSLAILGGLIIAGVGFTVIRTAISLPTVYSNSSIMVGMIGIMIGAWAICTGVSPNTG